MSELTSLIEGVENGMQDVDVCKILAKSWQLSSDPIARWHIAVKNESGVIYRIATLNSLDQMLDCLAAMKAIGLGDELQNAFGKVGGFDAIFGASPAIGSNDAEQS